MIRVLAVCVLWAFTTPLTAQEPSEIARRASRLYQGLTSLRAEFVQVIEDRMIGTQEASGELVQAGTAQLVMRFSDPAGDAIVLDGKYVWVYTPSTTPGQVIRLDLPHDPVYGPNVLARILDRPTERYQLRLVGTEIIDGVETDGVEFLPNVADPLFRRAVIWIDRTRGLPRRLELNELTGIHRTLDLTNITLNTPVSARTFAFQIPTGVRVVIQ